MEQSVFLIHDVLEKPFARQLAIDLSLAGATVWLDEVQTGGAQDSLIGKIDKKIRGQIYLAVILSPDSVGSDCVQREVEIALHRGVSGLIIHILPLLYKDCTIPAFMANKLCADFRNPSDYAGMLRRIIDRLGLGIGLSGKEPALPASLVGMWEGEWAWCGRQRNADMFLSSSPVVPCKMIIRYLKSGILTIVEQTIDVRISEKAVKLIGIGYRFLERGISLRWNLDTFNLIMGPSGMTLEGNITDKRGVNSPVLFKRI